MRRMVSASVQALGVHIRLELHQRFAGNALGILWTALVPLLQLALYALVFVLIFKARDPGIPGVSYLAFLAIGMWPWLAFAEAVTRAAGALVENSALISKVRIEPWHLIGARVIVAFGFHASGFVLVLLALSLTGLPLHFGNLHAVLVGWFLLMALAVACGVALALATVFIRDLQQLLPQVLTAALFLSPILYPVQAAPAFMQEWLQWNPIGGAIALVRDGLLTGNALLGDAFRSVAAIGVIGLLAWGMHRRLRWKLADYL